MGIESIAGTEMSYYLVSLDSHGQERTDELEGSISDLLVHLLRTKPVTDVFITCHGWKGDIPAARQQFHAWTKAMLAFDDDLRRARTLRAGFLPVVVGLHWPSLPWGLEDDAAQAFGAGEDNLEPVIVEAAAQLVDTPAARGALRVIFAAALDNPAPGMLPESVREAYILLDREAGLGEGELAGTPSEDRAPFDPDAAYRRAIDSPVDFGGGAARPLLSPLVQLSFWKMKDRARIVGEAGAFGLIAKLMNDAPVKTRFHLMGHSFGCIVVSAAVAGPAGKRLSRPVHSVFLVQGAMSHWSFCARIEAAKGKPGYFHRLVSEGRVAGPLVVTLSEHDLAVSNLYPLAAGLARQTAFDPLALPTYGAIGALGARGPGFASEDLDMLPSSGSYEFIPATLYNINAAKYICEKDGMSGAHNDIAKAEVAHAFWSAALL